MINNIYAAEGRNAKWTDLYYSLTPACERSPEHEDWEEIVSSSLAQDMTYTPYKMYLFVADEDTSYERNVLYDTYEVNVTREDGTVFTGYEACRYADLRIPADGVMTASYGSLQGFNFGYNYGFPMPTHLRDGRMLPRWRPILGMCGMATGWLTDQPPESGSRQA